MGYTSTSPATTFGGTWSSITGGKYFRAAAANNSAGTNSLSEKQMPSHSHELKFRTDNSASSNLTGQGYAGWESGGSEDRLYYGRYLQGRAITQFLDVSTERAGGALQTLEKHSTPLIRMFMLGDVLPNIQDGDV